MNVTNNNKISLMDELLINIGVVYILCRVFGKFIGKR